MVFPRFVARALALLFGVTRLEDPAAELAETAVVAASLVRIGDTKLQDTVADKQPFSHGLYSF
jgi:hypothetical protein